MRWRDTVARTYRRGLPKAVECLERDWDRLVAYDAFPQEHWTHLRTTNVIESPFAAVRLRTSAAKRFKNVDNATTLIWKTVLVVEQHFRKLNAPHLSIDVHNGAVFHDGICTVTPTRERIAGNCMSLFHTGAPPPAHAPSAARGVLSRGYL